MRYQDSDLEALFLLMRRLYDEDDAFRLFTIGRDLLDRIQELRSWR